MQTEALTSQDREWLTLHAEACRLLCDFTHLDLFYSGSPESLAAARDVLVWFQGSYISALEAAQRIQFDTPYSQVFEQWEFWVYRNMLAEAAKLPPLSARALMVAAGFGKVSSSQIQDAASEAVANAQREMYCEDFGEIDVGPVLAGA